MATMEELYQQYLLTQPGIGGSQNRYRDLMSQMRPFSNPYPAATGLLAGGTVAPAVPKTPAKTSPMGTYGGGGGLGLHDLRLERVPLGLERVHLRAQDGELGGHIFVGIGGGGQLGPAGNPDHHIVAPQPEVHRLHRRQCILCENQAAHPHRVQ